MGYCLVVPPEALNTTLATCEQAGYAAWCLGSVAHGAAPATGLAGLPFEA